MSNMAGKLRAFLAGEIVLFAVASLAHRGAILNGYEHARAAIAETVIGAVLSLGLVVSLANPAATRIAALWTQAFALLGVCVGLVMIAIGVGPRTAGDLVLHAIMLLALGLGLLAARRNGAAQEP